MLLFISQQDPHSLAGPTGRTVIALEGESNSSAVVNHYNNINNYNPSNNNNIPDHHNLNDDHLNGDKRHEETQSPLQTYSHHHTPQHYGFVHPALSHSLHDDYYSDYNRLNIHHHHHHHQAATLHKEHSSWNMEDPNCDTSINNLRSKLNIFKIKVF